MSKSRFLAIICTIIVLLSFHQLCYATVEYKITASDGAEYDYFGHSVSISGNRCIVGAYKDCDNGYASGSAYIFEFNGTSWVEQAKLTASDGAAGDYFGISVSISGNRCIVRADNYGSNNYCPAYIFEFNGTSWTCKDKITESYGTEEGHSSVSMSGDYAIIGYSGAGSAYVFAPNEIDPNDWNQVAKLTPSDGAEDFGYSVSANGDYAIVGAYGDHLDYGSAYIFKRDGDNWIQQAKLVASDGAAKDYFGYSVSISGNRCIVGAYGDDDNGSLSGSAYIFKRDGTNWSEQAKLVAYDGAPDNCFGRSVSISDNICIVGAYKDDDNGSNSGLAYIFEFNGTAWTQKTKLTASDAATWDFFGCSVSINGGRGIVGALYDDDKGRDSGSAYIYNLNMALAPNPADGESGVDPNVILSWAPGFGAASHDVYFGTNYDDVNEAVIGSPEYMGNFGVNSFDPCCLDFLTTYYWRIDEVNEPNIIKGDVWSFSTADPDGHLYVPSEYSTIQMAIDVAGDGSSVIVAPGTYTGPGNRDLDFLGKAITVQSINPNDQNIVAATIIDCNGSPNEPHRGFYFQNGEDENSILNGLTVTNGHGLDDYHSDADYAAGGGIYCYYSSPTIKNCIITENKASVGGGICCDNSSPTIKNCIITNNSITFQGGGLFGFNTNVSITDCVISGNFAISGCAVFIKKGIPLIDGCIIRNNSGGSGALNFDEDVAPEITNCLITGNPGGISHGQGVGGNAKISNCTIVNNGPSAWGGAIGWDGPGTVTNCICCDNHELYLSGGRREIEGDNLIVSYTNIQDNAPNDWKYVAGIGNIDVDPCFVNPDSNDFHLLPNSPCINAGDPNFIPEPNETDIDGQPRIMHGRVDMGADEGNKELLVPTQYPTIQAAIDDAFDGDTVIVAPGTYTGLGNRDIDFLGKAITVRSQSGPDNCIIDCNGTEEDLHRGFYFHSGEGQNSVLDGFTITNGCAHKGGAIWCRYSSSPTIINCVIRGNISPYEYVPDPFVPMVILQDGGGIYCSESSPIIKKCHFIENTATAGGGAICSWSGNALVDSCVFRSNSAGLGGGAIRLNGDNMSIRNCVITGNSADDFYRGGGAIYRGGGAIYCSGNSLDDGTPTIINCTISGNRAVRYGGGILCADNFYVTVSNSVVWGNYALEGHEVGLRYGGFDPPSLTISYSDIHNGAMGAYIQSGCTLNWGPGNIDIDPCFVEAGFWADVNDPNIIVEPNEPNAIWVNGDYHLKSEGWRWDSTHQRWGWDDVTSRCIDAGNPGSPLGDEPLSIPEDPNNIWGQNLRINMGAFGGSAEASIPPYDWALLSDVTNDGISDFNDLNILSSLWLNTGETFYADFNRDEIVDFFDFALLAQDWLLQTSWHVP